MADKDDLDFNEQAFLLDFFQETISTNNQIYSQFIQIEGDSAGIMNRLLTKGNPNILWNLSDAQLMLLVPKIAIYKIALHSCRNHRCV